MVPLWLKLFFVLVFTCALFKVIHKIESVERLTHLVLDTPHGGYPVVTKTDKEDEVFSGLISR